MQGTKVILGTYNTMPDGASGKVFELTYQRSWRPFLSSLYKFPTVSAVIFYSGVVLQWIEDNHPEFLLLLEEMIGRKQIELLGGGYFNPFFPALQPADKIGQIEMLTTYLRKAFGKRPSGGWLYEYLWDSSVPLIFRNAGFNYSFLPATALKEAGFLDSDCPMPLATEDQRRIFYVFPVHDLGEDSGRLETFESALEKLMFEKPGCPLYSIMVDGHLVQKMWERSGLESPDVMFEKTFAWFQRNCLEIETTLSSSYIKTIRNAKLFYLTACSSKSLFNALNAGRKNTPAQRYCAPAVSRELILKNGASKQLYEKMYHVHTLMTLLRGDKARKKSAQEDLWRAQNGEAYWEGTLGGIRRPDARAMAYKALIEAEKATRVHGSFVPGLVLDDLDCDGEREALYQAQDYNCYVHLKGARAFELDSMRSKHNYFAAYDNDSRSNPGCFTDSVRNHGSFREELANLANQQFSMLEKEKSAQRAVFAREFRIDTDNVHIPLAVRKIYTFQKGCLSVDMELVNNAQSPVALRYATEINLLMPGLVQDLEVFAQKGHDTISASVDGGEPDTLVNALTFRPAASREYVEIRSDKAFAYTIHHVRDNFDSLYLPAIRQEFSDATVFLEGREEFYQGTKALFGWDFTLAPDATVTFSLTLHLRI